MYIVTTNAGSHLVAESRISMSLDVRRQRFPLRVIPNFYMWEMVCPCCGLYILDSKFLRKLQDLRNQVNTTVSVNSWFRCSEYNARPIVDGAPNSWHQYGVAVDIRSSVGVSRLNEVARSLGFFVLLYPNYIHIDGRNW